MDERPDLPAGADAVSGPLGVGNGVSIPGRELSWRFSRSSGPGGQGVNTTDSRIELSLDLRDCAGLTPQQRARVLDRLGPRLVDGVITVAAAEFRSQLRNRRAARERLAALLAEALAPPPPRRKATKPSRGAVKRRLDDKARRAKIKKLRNSWD
ncbi:MAG TPA: alternative ribosome rescue aminoacyl-tRNA hydrolase ArfB [Actinospica sp.]|jgi:ribosome-associated protein|nr:alternative ribosome rescue aminoacyl-tRNA hydrolase ArfB [Actinospica sp.]